MVKPFLNRLAALTLSGAVFAVTSLKAEEASSLLAPALRAARLDAADVTTRPERWDTHFTLPLNESLLKYPLTGMAAADRWTNELRKARGSVDYVDLAAGWLGAELPPPRSVTHLAEIPASARIPPALIPPLRKILQALNDAQPALNESVDSLSAPERQSAARAWAAVMTNRESEADLDTAVPESEKFDRRGLFSALQSLTLSIDETLPELTVFRPSSAKSLRRRWHSAAGDILVVVGDEERYSSKDLEGVALLLNFSRKSRYDGPVAGAKEHQIRVVLDFAEDVIVDSEASSPSAGAGVFGIGLLYLPNPRGMKSLKTGDLSAGAGLFGAGGLFLNGPTKISGHSGTQGAAAFGIGLLVNATGDNSAYAARFGAQGAGFTQGAGLLFQRGSNTEFEGGLFFPDAREPLAMTSICQGVGYGPRAYAAGGIGILSLDGNENRLTSSYFAQGSGYWHGTGVCLIKGNKNRLQARRYDQGAGIHTAVGILRIEGHNNSTINWGVGPAYGWDFGVGIFTARGDDNTFQTDWSPGHGDVNGWALVSTEGNRNRFSLPDFGSGSLARNMPSYGLALTQGTSNQVMYPGAIEQKTETANLYAGPWGVWSLQGLTTIAPKISLPVPIWPTTDRSEAARNEASDHARKLSEAAKKPRSEQIIDWLGITSDFGFDAATPMEARRNLLRLSPNEVPLLVQRFSADRYDEFIELRLILSGYGRPVASSVIQKLPQAHGTLKAILLGQLAFARPQDAFETAMAALRDNDWRIRRGGAGVLTSWFNREEGPMVGRLTMLTRVREALRHPETAGDIGWGEKYPNDILALLALDPSLTAEDRIAFMDHAVDPLSPLTKETLKAAGDLLLRKKSAYLPLIEKELKDVEQYKDRARKALLPILQDPDHDTAQGALLALGMIGDRRDAPALAKFLGNPTALLREAASTGLAKMGPAGEAVISRALRDPSKRVRLSAVQAAWDSWDEVTAQKLAVAFHDSSEDVRLNALAGLLAMNFPSKTLHGYFFNALQKLESENLPPDEMLLAKRAEKIMKEGL